MRSIRPVPPAGTRILRSGAENPRSSKPMPSPAERWTTRGAAAGAPGAAGVSAGPPPEDVACVTPAGARSNPAAHSIAQVLMVGFMLASVGTFSVTPASGMLSLMARITGIGGVFFKSRTDHKELAAWYARHLGLTLEAWGGAILKWPDDKAADRGLTVWHVADKSSDWFSPSESSFMINYRVDDLDELLAQLRRDGVPI